VSILVTGAAGYIGSVTAEALRAKGLDVVVLDNLAYGHRAAVGDGVPFYEGNVGDAGLVRRIIDEHHIDACVHFAAFAYVGESVTDPSKYFNNNTIQTTALLDALIAGGVKKVVFSSTCATYGDPVRMPMDEDHPQSPVNPYGWSKFMSERVMEAYDRAYGLKYVALRYFNAAGATDTLGEHHDPETHLIPNVLKAATGELEFVSVFGSDYDTPDGTCIRDYIHVSDLADAHILALEHLDRTGESNKINLGNGLGFSVLEVIEAARKVTGRPIEARMEERRPGDPARLIADSRKAIEVLGWKPQLPGIDTIVESAWRWKQRFPTGYAN
jgi:UDP-glucose 4-epimerase